MAGDTTGGAKPPSRAGGWSRLRGRRFLEVLADGCDPAAAAEAAGMQIAAAYRQRRRDPVFATGWDEALAASYARLEQALLRHALIGLGALPGGGRAAATAGSAQIALALLQRQAKPAEVIRRGRTAPARPPRSDAEIYAEFNRRLEAMAPRPRPEA